jgi:hypothetical protein
MSSAVMFSTSTGLCPHYLLKRVSVHVHRAESAQKAVKLTPHKPRKHKSVWEVWLHSINFSIIKRSEVTFTSHPLAATMLQEDRLVPTVCMDALELQRYFVTLSGIKPRLFRRPASSLVNYRLHYPGSMLIKYAWKWLRCRTLKHCVR